MLEIDKKIRQLYEITDEHIKEISKYGIKQSIFLDNLSTREDIDNVKKAFHDVIHSDIQLLIDLINNPSVDIDNILDIKEKIAVSDSDYDIDGILSSYSSVENGTAAQDLEKMFNDDQEDNESLIYFKIPSQFAEIEEVISSKTALDILDVDVYNEVRVNSLSFNNSGIHPNEEITVSLELNNMNEFLVQLSNVENGVISFILPTAGDSVRIISSAFSVEDTSLYFEKSEVNFIINSPYLVSQQFSVFILGFKDNKMSCGMWSWDKSSFLGVEKENIKQFDKSIGLNKVFYQDINTNIIDFISTTEITLT